MPDENSDVRLFSTSSFAMKYVKPSGEVVKTVLDNPVSCFIRNTIMERTYDELINEWFMCNIFE